jgi:uncharacterized protein (DUF952 family)
MQLKENHFIYHITTANNWYMSLERKYYAHHSLEAEGFIHCCTKEQLKGVFERYFVNEKEQLLKLIIDTEKVEAIIKYEFSPSTNEFFPHIFGNININAITDVEQINIEKL